MRRFAADFFTALTAAMFLAIAVWQGSAWLGDREHLSVIETRLARPPMPLSKVLAGPGDQMLFQRVTAEAFPNRGEIYIPARDGWGRGMKIIVPLRLVGSRYQLLADMTFRRGPAPNAVIPQFVYADDQTLVRGIAYTGVLLPSQSPGPGDDPPDFRRWVWPVAHLPSMVEAMKVSASTTVYLYVESASRGSFNVRPYAAPRTGFHFEAMLASLTLAIVIPVYLVTSSRKPRSTSHGHV